jgi:hypothetical protein
MQRENGIPSSVRSVLSVGSLLLGFLLRTGMIEQLRIVLLG